MKHSFRKLCISICAIFAATALAAACSSSSGLPEEGPGIGDSSTLIQGDFPGEGVCANGSTDVSDASFVAALAAMTEFTILHLPYSSDSDIPFICGKENVWDPSTANALTPSGSGAITTATTIATIFGGVSGSVFICNNGFGFTSGTTEGLRSATTWRGEITITDGTNTYQLRLRFTVTGDDANKTLAELGITAGDLFLVDANGNTLTTVAEVLALFSTDPASVTVSLMSGSTTHLEALGRVICWQQM